MDNPKEQSSSAGSVRADGGALAGRESCHVPDGRTFRDILAGKLRTRVQGARLFVDLIGRTRTSEATHFRTGIRQLGVGMMLTGTLRPW